MPALKLVCKYVVSPCTADFKTHLTFRNADGSLVRAWVSDNDSPNWIEDVEYSADAIGNLKLIPSWR